MVPDVEVVEELELKLLKVEVEVLVEETVAGVKEVESVAVILVVEELVIDELVLVVMLVKVLGWAEFVEESVLVIKIFKVLVVDDVDEMVLVVKMLVREIVVALIVDAGKVELSVGLHVEVVVLVNELIRTQSEGFWQELGVGPTQAALHWLLPPQLQPLEFGPDAVINLV